MVDTGISQLVSDRCFVCVVKLREILKDVKPTVSEFSCKCGFVVSVVRGSVKIKTFVE